MNIFMARERRHGLSIQRDNTNCKTRILKRCSRFIAGFFWQSSSARAVQLLGGGGLKLARLRCQAVGLKWRRHGGGKFGFIDYESLDRRNL